MPVKPHDASDVRLRNYMVPISPYRLMWLQVRVNALRDSRTLTNSTVDLIAAANASAAGGTISLSTLRRLNSGNTGSGRDRELRKTTSSDARDPQRGRLVQAGFDAARSSNSSAGVLAEDERKSGKEDAGLSVAGGSELLRRGKEGGIGGAVATAGAGGAAAAEPAVAVAAAAADAARKRDPLWEFKQQVNELNNGKTGAWASSIWLVFLV